MIKDTTLILPLIWLHTCSQTSKWYWFSHLTQKKSKRCQTIPSTSALSKVTCKNLRGGDDDFLGGDWLSSGSVLCPSQSPVHRRIPGPYFRDSAIDLLQLLDGNVGDEHGKSWEIRGIFSSIRRHSLGYYEVGLQVKDWWNTDFNRRIFALTNSGFDDWIGYWSSEISMTEIKDR